MSFLRMGAVVLAVATACGVVAAADVYQTDFNSLAPGQTLPSPGRAGQDGWFSSSAGAPSFGEIVLMDANVGQVLHERSDAQNSVDQPTVDTRPISPPDLTQTPLIHLSFKFYCHSSDYSNINNYAAAMNVSGATGSGLNLLHVTVAGGNGVPKSDTGVAVVLYSFNGVDNNEYIPLTVGGALGWDAWHSLELVADQASDHYVSLTVDGQSQDLSAFRLTYDQVAPGVWQRGQLMENINGIMNTQRGLDPNATTDDVYWDNLSLSVEAPEPATIGMLVLGGLALVRRRRAM